MKKHETKRFRVMVADEDGTVLNEIVLLVTDGIENAKEILDADFDDESFDRIVTKIDDDMEALSLGREILNPISFSLRR